MSDLKIFSQHHIKRAMLQEKASRSVFSSILIRAYRFPRLRNLCLSLCSRLEEDRFFSKSLRDILKKYHDVEVGAYSYGPCLIPKTLPRGSRVGSYCSFGGDLQVFRRNHPGTTLSQHPFFYNSQLGYVKKDTINLDQENPLIIGNDVWIGNRVTILPSCKNIGDGAMIGAGSVVTKNVESFTIVAGNPARFLKRRYAEDVETSVVRSKWWTLSLPDLLKAQNMLVEDVTVESLNSFLLDRKTSELE